MRITKVLGLAALAAVTAMAFIGTGSATAQDKIVLCKELVTLCPTGKLWPKGTKFLVLAKEPELIGTLPVKCEDSTGTGEIIEEIGSPLNFKITALAFGKLPTPAGTGCTNCENVKVNGLPLSGSIEVEAVDKYFFKSEGSATLEKCTAFKVTCGFKGTIKVEIKHDGSHPLHSGTNLPLITFEKELTRTEGSELLCGNSGIWKASYVLYLADPPTGESGLAWPSLDK